jgi:hypothetical protein
VNKGMRFSDEFKRDSLVQVVDRGYAVTVRWLSGWGSAPSRCTQERHNSRVCLSEVRLY